MKKIKGIPKIVIYIAVGGGVLFVAFFIITSLEIGKSVKEQCRLAQVKYSAELPANNPDCAQALIMTLEDENRSYRQRNMAIWALGQLGDKRGLSVLDKYYTGVIPDREPYDQGISQYELKKAIKLLQNGFNATAFLWR